MKFLVLLAAVFSFSNMAQAEDHKSMICESGQYKLTTYQSVTGPDQVLILVQKEEVGIYSQVFNFIYQAAPVQAWSFTEAQNPENSVAVAATSEAEAVASIKIDLGEEGLLRIYDAKCQLNVFAKN